MEKGDVKQKLMRQLRIDWVFAEVKKSRMNADFHILISLL